MEQIVEIGFKYGMLLAGSVGLVGYLIGLGINLLENFGRG